jgi:hypothetical protein
MPVSKKRKKDGKPVHRHVAETPVPEGEEHAHGPEGKPATPQVRMGRPTNPFVAQQQSKRGAQRGR